MNDESGITSLLGLRLETHDASGLDAKTFSLVRLASLVAVGAAPVTYQWATEAAIGAGAADDEIIGTLVTVAPIVGAARIVAAATDIAMALGYPIDAELEVMNPPVHFPRRA
jgi:alkylhydroperoxidase/carboxymuconolactone decarboxylase family protein YurZ